MPEELEELEASNGGGGSKRMCVDGTADADADADAAGVNAASTRLAAPGTVGGNRRRR